MSLPLLRMSTSKIAAILICVSVWGCSDPLDTTSSDSSLGSACAGDGGLVPTPVVPQSLRAWKKFAIPDRLFQKSSRSKTSQKVLPPSIDLVALVDEVCVLSKTKNEKSISGLLRERVSKQKSLMGARAYSLRMKNSYSRSQMMKKVKNDSCLIHISEDTRVSLFTTVNDPLYSSQKHLTAIGASTAWDTFYSGLSGNVVVAIIDDGMQMDHPDLSGVLWTNDNEIAGNSVDDDGNGYVDDVNGYNFASDLSSPAHENGSTHGTHVAGLAAARGNNSVGVSGVAGKNAKIMVLNVFGSSGSASSADIVNAINYARTMGADVINMSLGGVGTSAAVETAMSNAVASGTFIAVAAGNDNALVTESNFYMPMGYAKDIEGAMAVGSVDAVTLDRSSFSNYSTTYVEIGAPGSNSATGGVLSTYPTSTYDYLQGTSMASPVLAGAAAAFIGWVNSRGGSISPAQVEAYLKSSADSSSSLTNYFLDGALLNFSNLASTANCNF